MDVVERKLSYEICGSAMDVLNALGHGLREKTYERSLCVELRHRGIAFTQQAVYPVYYRDVHVDDFVPDLVVENRVIVDTKVVEALTDVHRGQIMNYLHITGLELGILLNFKHPKLESMRVVLTAPQSKGRAQGLKGSTAS